MDSFPAVKALKERHHARGLRVIGVTRTGVDDEERAFVREVAEKHAMTAPTFVDPDGAWSKSANIAPIPGFLLIDKEGRIAYRYVGKLTSDGDAFKDISDLVERM